MEYHPKQNPVNLACKSCLSAAGVIPYQLRIFRGQKYKRKLSKIGHILATCCLDITRAIWHIGRGWFRLVQFLEMSENLVVNGMAQPWHTQLTHHEKPLAYSRFSNWHTRFYWLRLCV